MNLWSTELATQTAHQQDEPSQIHLQLLISVNTAQVHQVEEAILCQPGGDESLEVRQVLSAPSGNLAVSQRGRLPLQKQVANCFFYFKNRTCSSY